MSAPTLTAYRVFESMESHIVIAFDDTQARGIAFGHRFADPDEWDSNTMAVEPMTALEVMRTTIHDENDTSATPDQRVPLTRLIARATERGEAEYAGGSLW